MSTEYFSVKEVDASKFYEDFNNNNKSKDVDSYSVTSRISQDVKLHEMEEQLEIAETRCNTLKDQLDQMKRLYQNKAEIPKLLKSRSRKTSYSARSVSPPKTPVDVPLKSESEIRTDAINYSTSTLCQDDQNIVVLPVRQNSHAISTDNTGAAVQTINNILTGITNSVNRLSELHVHLESEGSKSRPTSSRRNKLRDSACGDDESLITAESKKFTARTRTRSENPRQLTNLPEEPMQDGTTDEVRCQRSSVISIKSKSGHKKKFKKKSQTNKGQNSTITVNITAKRSVKSTAKHVEKKFKIEPVKMVGKDSNSMLAPKKFKKPIRRIRQGTGMFMERKAQAKVQNANIETDKLVELYHNTAAKGSDTDSSNPEISKSKLQSDEKAQKSSKEIVSTLPVEEMCDTYEYKPPESVYNYRDNRQLSPIDERGYMEPIVPRTDCFSSCSKNYELPTIASKMKQVAKSYMRQFNFHSIPFCAAKSTSPSHNIGINIQQVMSIIKTRQPITGISPTLAHNIGLAADKLHNRPFSAIVSSLGSRIGYGRSQCPLLRNNLNYQQLQEMAKEIPEEPCEDDDLTADGADRIPNESGASGDMNRMSHQSTMWTIDPAHRRNCTCVPPQGIGFQQVLSRYNSNTLSSSTVSQIQSRLLRQRFPRYTVQPRKLRANSWPVKQEKIQEIKETTGLKGKEKNLKEVLTNLHNEFQSLNDHYETMSKQLQETDEPDEQTVKELENMERCLNNKEEEITMVMELYKEVLALKQQVKVLKEKASLASVALNHPQVSRFREYNNPSAAIHLTKLLRQIQTYQGMYKIGRRN